MLSTEKDLKLQPAKKARLMKNATFYFDLETTGFSGMDIYHKEHRIVQIAACDESGKETIDIVVDPKCYIHPNSTAIHGIDNKRCENALDVQAAVLYLFEWIERNSEDCPIIYLVAHNNFGFDAVMLLKEIELNHIRFSNDLISKIKLVDSLQIFRAEYPDLKKYNLGLLHEHFFNAPIENAHNAAADVTALCRLCKEQLKHMALESWSVPLYTQHAFIELDVTAPLSTVRYIGVRRVQHLTRAGFETLEKLQSLSLDDLETTLREGAYVSSDTQLLSIMAQVKNLNPILLVKKRYPRQQYWRYKAVREIVEDCRAFAIFLKKKNIKTIDQLRLYKMLHYPDENTFKIRLGRLIKDRKKLESLLKLVDRSF